MRAIRQSLSHSTPDETAVAVRRLQPVQKRRQLVVEGVVILRLDVPDQALTRSARHLADHHFYRQAGVVCVSCGLTHFQGLAMNTIHTGRALSVSLITACILLSGCAGMTHRQQNAATGAAVGGVAGAVLTGGSALGTVGGAAIGGLIGHGR